MLHYHPILVFLLFVPSFASLVLLVALATWGLTALYLNSTENADAELSGKESKPDAGQQRTPRYVYPHHPKVEAQSGMAAFRDESATSSSTGLESDVPDSGAETVQERDAAGRVEVAGRTTGSAMTVRVKDEVEDDGATVGGVSASVKSVI